MRVMGIPCIVAVAGYAYQPRSQGSPWACASDADYYGYEEIDWVIRDRRGRAAPWLERQLSPSVRQEITARLSGAIARLAQWEEAL